jgi:hypothetical protein
MATYISAISAIDDGCNHFRTHQYTTGGTDRFDCGYWELGGVLWGVIFSKKQISGMEDTGPKPKMVLLKHKWVKNHIFVFTYYLQMN